MAQNPGPHVGAPDTLPEKVQESVFLTGTKMTAEGQTSLGNWVSPSSPPHPCLLILEQRQFLPRTRCDREHGALPQTTPRPFL